ncbi:MAG: heme NO-binding domain-containing protein [Paracoccus sp. (in: a-proteobacteria)]
MIGLVDRAIEEFLRATYGEELLRSVTNDMAVAEGKPLPDLQGYGQVGLAQAAHRMSKSGSEMLEDLGSWLTRIEPIRRVMRFSGRDFKDFLMSLEELPGRAHLVVPWLDMPRLRVAHDARSVMILIDGAAADWQPVLIGLIRGMADDYGALCLISAEEGSIRVDIWDECFAAGRLFRLQPDATAASAAEN